MNCAAHTKCVPSSYSNRSLCQLHMTLFHDPLIKYSGCNLVMPCTSSSGQTSIDVRELAWPAKTRHSTKEEPWNTETVFLPTAHLSEHFNVITLKLAICFDCSHHSKHRSFLEHLCTPFYREVRGQQSVTEHSTEAVRFITPLKDFYTECLASDR